MLISGWSSDVCSSDLLIVAGRRSPREVGDDSCIHSDLFGDVVENDCRQQLAWAQMSPRIAQAAELQGIAQAGRRSACEADRSKVLGIEAMMSHHRRLAVGQSKQRGALPLGHRNTCGHVSSSKNLLPFVGLVKEDCERPKAAEIGACCFRLQIRPFRSEEHTSELQSLMRISYAVFCLKKKKYTNTK